MEFVAVGNVDAAGLKATARQIEATARLQQPSNTHIDVRAHGTIKHYVWGCEAQASTARAAQPTTLIGTARSAVKPCSALRMHVRNRPRRYTSMPASFGKCNLRAAPRREAPSQRHNAVMRNCGDMVFTRASVL